MLVRSAVARGIVFFVSLKVNLNLNFFILADTQERAHAGNRKEKERVHKK